MTRFSTSAGAAIVSAAVLSMVAATGCQSTLPETAPHRDQVFAAAREVLSQRYAMSSSTERYAQLYALTEVELNGTAKSRKQISIAVRPNFTGAFEPRVTVTEYVEWGQPPHSGDPGTVYQSRNQFMGVERWKPLQRLPLEEQAIAREILDKVRPQGI